MHRTICGHYFVSSLTFSFMRWRIANSAVPSHHSLHSLSCLIITWWVKFLHFIVSIYSAPPPPPKPPPFCVYRVPTPLAKCYLLLSPSTIFLDLVFCLVHYSNLKKAHTYITNFSSVHSYFDKHGITYTHNFLRCCLTFSSNLGISDTGCCGLRLSGMTQEMCGGTRLQRLLPITKVQRKRLRCQLVIFVKLYPCSLYLYLQQFFLSP